MCEHGAYDYAWDESIRHAVEPLRAELDSLKFKTIELTRWVHMDDPGSPVHVAVAAIFAICPIPKSALLPSRTEISTISDNRIYVLETVEEVKRRIAE